MTYTPPLMTSDVIEGDALKALHSTQRALSTLNWMLNQTLSNERGDAGIMSEYAEGLYDLIEMQTDVLRGVEEKIVVMIDKKNELLAVLQRQEPEPAGVLVAAVHELRAQIIEEKTKEGLTVSLIGRALGMNNGAVERVIQQLQGEPSAARRRSAQA